MSENLIEWSIVIILKQIILFFLWTSNARHEWNDLFQKMDIL